MTLPTDGAPGRLHRHLRIDLAGCTDKAEVLARVAHSLRFPPCFGHNWDALADCLGDLSWLPASAYRITLANTQELCATAPEVFSTLLEVLADASAWWAGQGMGFSVEVDAGAAGNTCEGSGGT